MASSTGKLCGPCEARYKSTTAISWCMNCDDGLCSSCLEDHKVNKASKKHQTIPVGQYEGIESVSSLIKQECEEHDQILSFYCLDHCVTVCALCVPEKHKQCTSLKPIEELASNAKTSTELFNIEKGIKELGNTVDELKNHRQRNIDTIKDQRETISRKIKSLRNQINVHLDKVESDLLKELESKSDKNISEINLLLSKLKKKGKHIKSLEKTMNQVKEILSDVQVFLVTQSLAEKLREDHDWVSKICNQDEGKESILELFSEPRLEKFLTDLTRFGTINVVRYPCQVKVGSLEQQSAQLHVPTSAERDIDHTELELVRKISFSSNACIKDCVLVNDGRMVFVCSNYNKVLVYTPEGRLSKSIRVGDDPCGLAFISFSTLAVTCHKVQIIQLINIDDGVVVQMIHVWKPCSGLSYSYDNDRLYVTVRRTGIMEFDLSGNNIRTIPVDIPSDDCYLTSYKDMFCYTCYDAFITCCDSKGTIIWRSDIADSGVSVDSFGNYYALNYRDATLQIVSQDGKKTKQLLSMEQRNAYLEGVFFDKNSSTLLVACRKGFAMLYHVI